MDDQPNKDQGAAIRRAREARGWSQAKLGEMAGGADQQTIGKIEAGIVRHSKYLEKIKELLGISRIDTGYIPQVISPIQPFGEADLPLHGTAEGGGGSVIVSSEPVDWLRRPASLANVKDAYGVIVSDDSMEPRFEQGETVLIHPHLPPTPHTDIVLYAEVDGELRAMIRRLLRMTATEWFLRQYNPRKDFQLPRKVWNKCHRIVDVQMRR